MDPRFPGANKLRTRPMLTSPRNVATLQGLNATVYRMGASPAAVEWWDTHVYRTHLRSPVSSPRASTAGSGIGLSPRSLKTPLSPIGSPRHPLLATSFPGFATGAMLPPKPGERSKGPKYGDPMTDTVPMSKGGVSDHPLKMQLSQMYKGMKMMDLDGDGNLAPTDIARGLGAFGLSVGSDKSHTNAVNLLITKCMSSAGTVSYSKFVYALASDPILTEAIMKTLETKKAKAEAASAPAAAKPSGPQLRPGVTPDMLRAAQQTIKEKLFDKYSGLTAAFRAMDKDGSGFVSRSELEGMLLTLNLNSIKQPVIDTLIDFIDVSDDVADDDDAGATDIGYREFARAFATDDIMSMQALATLTRPPPTPPPQNLVASSVSTVIQSKFKPHEMKMAFEFLDSDKSKSLSRAEIKRTLATWGSVLTDEELGELFRVCDKDGDGKIDYEEFCDMIAKNPALTGTRSLVKNPALRPGVRESDLRKAQHVIKDRFLTKFGKFQEAFKFIDRDRTGTIDREELRLVIQEFNLSTIKPEVIENLIDFIDIDDGSSIEYKEFARVLSADDVMAMSPLSVQPAATQRTASVGRHKMTDMPGAQGTSWTDTAR